ncbi:diacylglycerol kinase family protein [Lysinibacillus sp. FSL M8-0216]|uniref:Undecaprenol kinase n=1 Tax=Lysinibacillus fusiformis TaxID=28031 RepID=A0A1H9IQ05_9BACI|nr:MULTISPECIES: diacylglycerol kinase family protein [Lysinibacillus]EAZ84467.1 diacylglycerol kinase [Bacillus sp. B14905]HAU32960.1 diacylglycerol kinase family protein [Lysinibacillus sp.]MCG7435621.1 diacylglycerol kinase family protein [Lysinibacillus fusiformis]MED4078522.1 diacylglycerol kinase family protein [Lysinibacillus fusiformis]MED4670456.1 diacylglycerol kinase family protein [Lysinibacillus fusiformis]
MDLRKYLRSFGYAFEGIITASKEQNLRSHIVSAVIVILAGYFTGLSRTEWYIVLLLIALMFALEMINTAIERVVDLASPNLHPLAKQAKDIAAGAVLVFALFSAIIGLLIFLPKWL